MALSFDNILGSQFLDEGNGGGATPISLVVSRSGDLTAAAAYEWSIIPGTDTVLIGGGLVDAADFLDPLADLPSGVALFPPGQATATLSFALLADDQPEPDGEGFRVVVSDPGGNPEEISVDFFIRNDDTPSIALTVEPQVIEGDLLFRGVVKEDAEEPLRFRLSLSKASSLPLTIFFSLGDTSAAPVAAGGFRFQGVQPTLLSPGNYAITLAPGQSSATLEVVPQPDAIDEPDQTLQLRISPDAAYANAPTISGTIRDDDAPSPPVVHLSVSPTTVLEDGSGNLIYTFTRSGPTTAALTLTYSVSGSALAAANGTDPADYTGLPAASTNGSRQITIPAGASSASLRLDPIADARPEPDELVTLQLLAGQGYLLGENKAATAVIRDDDARVSLRVTPAEIQEDGGRPLRYVFQRSGALERPLTVRYGVGGSASLSTGTGQTADVRGLPLGANRRRVRFPIGVARLTLPVRAVADRGPEPDETLTLSVLPGRGYEAAASAATATAVIADDDRNNLLVRQPQPITIPDRGAAGPYPSSLRVDGLTGSLVDVTVQLFSLRHPNPGDLDILLISPTGTSVMLMSDAGRSFDLNGVDLTFRQQAGAALPESVAIRSGSFRPTDHGLGRDALPAPAPAGPFRSDLSRFRGENPNGDWRLLVFDDLTTNAGSGAISGGWALNLTTAL